MCPPFISGVFLPRHELRGERRPLSERSGSLSRSVAPRPEQLIHSVTHRIPGGVKVSEAVAPSSRLVCLGSARGSPLTMTVVQAHVFSGRPRDLLPSVVVVEDE